MGSVRRSIDDFRTEKVRGFVHGTHGKEAHDGGFVGKRVE